MWDVLDAAAAKYVIHQRLGQGGMGVVHLGTMISPAGERRVAIKQLLRGTAKPGAAERIVAEARLVFQLTHANICQVLDLASSEEGTFIVMEYVEGCDLKTLMARSREAEEPLPVAAAVHIVREVAEALDYAHRRKDNDGRALWLIHGDVTPQNILLSREGEVKLADFGIARALGGIGPGDALRAGTPGFLAPESKGGGAIDQRVDVYGLGVTLYAALLGASPPRSGPDLLDLARRRPDLSPRLIAILERACAVDRGSRYGSIAEVRRALSEQIAAEFSSFSSETLADLVRARTETRQIQVEERERTLVSIARTIRSEPTLPDASMADGASATRRTQTVGDEPSAAGSVVSPRPGGKRRIAIAIAVLVALVAFAGVYSATSRSPLSATVAAVPVVPTASPAASPTRAAPDTEPIATASPPPTTPARKTKARASHSSSSAATAAEPGYLTLNSEPWGVVYVDGHRFANETPVYRAKVSAGMHRVHVVSPDRHGRSPTREVNIEPGKNHVISINW